MLQESILQYFRPSLSYHLSLRPLFRQFLSGRLRQVLQYENLGLDTRKTVFRGLRKTKALTSLRILISAFINRLLEGI